jgi:hypothetical protein
LFLLCSRSLAKVADSARSRRVAAIDSNDLQAFHCSGAVVQLLLEGLRLQCRDGHARRTRGDGASVRGLKVRLSEEAMSFGATMTIELKCLRRFELSATGLMVSLGLLYLFMIISRVFVTNIYNNAMLSDLFSLLDGAYRVHSGEIADRDFSSTLGVFAYALPAAFMFLGVDLIRSFDYSEALFVAIAFLVYLYIQRTRLDAMAGFFLGVWIPLALLARMNFGDHFEFVTEAMQYNRRCDVFLLLSLLLFIPPSRSTRTLLVIDGVLFGTIAAFLFYTKITFGLVALGAAPILLLRKRENITIIAVGAVVFIVIAAAVELGYGMRLGWLSDIRMANEAVGRSQFNRVLHLWRDNGVELFVLLFIPALILLILERLSIVIALFGAYIAITSTLLIAYSAQSYILTLPIAFLFVALDTIKPVSIETKGINDQLASYALYSCLVSCLLLIESYPLAINVTIATYRALHGVPLDAGNEILKKIVTDGNNDESDPYSVWIRDGKISQMNRIDAFAVGRATKPRHYWDSLSMREFGDYLTGGMSAAREGCEDRARIMTLDWGNPFPLLLGWPTGGGMTYVAAGYTVSEKAHLSNDAMFRDVNCVMIPKLPAIMGSRDLLESIYGPFLFSSFVRSYESDLWTVLRRRS